MNPFRTIYSYCKGLYITRSSQSYLDSLREKGVSIGEGTVCHNPRHIKIDMTRPSLLSIGKHVYLHENMTIMVHDWSAWVFRKKYGTYIPSHRPVFIGDNVFFGMNVMVLPGAHIGNNCIIGACSVVTGVIPDNTVAAGTPCKPICSLDDYYQKRIVKMEEDARLWVKSIREKYHREPTPEDLFGDYPLFVDGSNYEQYNYPYSANFSPTEFENWKKTWKSKYHGFEDLMKHFDNDSEQKESL